MRNHVVFSVVAILVAIPLYDVTRTWLLRESGWKVTVRDSVVRIKLGTTNAERAVDAFVAFQNNTDDNIRVVGVQSSCSCVIPITELPLVLSPRRTSVLNVRVKVGEHVLNGDALSQMSFVFDTSSTPVSVTFVAELGDSQ